jgi:hypothetical protein
MPTQITGSGGPDKVQPNSVGTAALQAGAVTPAKTEMGALPSMIRLHTANGYGSTNTTIRRFSTLVLNQGTDITYADSATLGATFTIIRSGVYSISFSDSTSSASGMSLGVSLNSTQLTTDINAITAADRLISTNTPPSPNYRGCCSVTVHLVAGSVIRAHTDGASGGGATAIFTITRVA